MAHRLRLLDVLSVLVLSFGLVHFASSVVVTESTGSGVGSLPYVLANVTDNDYVTFAGSITSVIIGAPITVSSVTNITIDGEGRVLVSGNINSDFIFKFRWTTNTRIINLSINSLTASGDGNSTLINGRYMNGFFVDRCNLSGTVDVKSSDVISITNTNVTALSGRALKVEESYNFRASGNTFLVDEEGLWITQVSGALVDSNTIDAPDFALFFQYCEDCHATGNLLIATRAVLYAGAAIYALDSERVVLRNNQITASVYGIAIVETSYIEIETNQISAENGLYISRKTNAIISRNLITAASEGIFIKSSSGILDGNQILSYDGIYADSVTNLTVTNNTMEVSNTGIVIQQQSMSNDSKITIEFNQVKGSSTAGIKLTNYGEISVKSNIIQSGGYGIQLNCVSDSLFQSNIISFNNDVGIFSNCTSGGGRNGFDANLIGFNSGGGIKVIDPIVAPTIDSVYQSSSEITVSVSLTELPNQDYVFQFFANQECDPSGLGQGEIYLGNLFVTSDASVSHSIPINCCFQLIEILFHSLQHAL